MRWFRKVYQAGSNGNADLVMAIKAVTYYEAEYEIAKSGVRPRQGERIEAIACKIPGMVEEHYAQLYDLESILGYLETREKKARIDKTQHFMEHYNRTLSEKLARDYAEASDDVQAVIASIQNVAATRNLFAGLHKAVDALNYQISNVTRLRVAGLDEATI